MSREAKRVPPSDRWEPFGTHLHRFEPPDLYIVRIRGNVLGEDMLAQVEALQALAELTGRGVFWVADVSEMGSLTPQARRVAAADEFAGLRAIHRGSAVIGASFTTRVMATLLIRAVRVLEPHRSRPVAFVETEAEARAFLEPYRRHGAGASVAP
ncbi:STAS/SEC14 domain-containing protein [Polyangium sp. y55x31]|uniref:STAS/SEC14 domain-containing protein n=1 Tax=Polyangium sp. y55x31 TaxID=3042688 RepID=UPI002482FBA6|nr:STAS/SEC14 domain-containing protein [Polyangium sp. y55x31]MDI1478858.1 STAS/SEC14 domain-containing protein [Polyangium sp. y55x31]